MVAPYGPLHPPARTLMGPGPSPVAPSVLLALAKPTLGHLDPAFLVAMDEVRAMLRIVFGSDNALTFPVSGTGSAGMEAILVNLIEPGDRVLVGVNGVFGARMVEVATRAGAEVTQAVAEWGRALAPEQLVRAANGRPHKLVCLVHAETSTGVLQPLEPMKAVADALGALLVVDAVTSLGGVAVSADAVGIDAAYSGTQKCLSCPPGLAPVTFSARARESLTKRTRKVQSWYLDLGLVQQYWGDERVYHHTAPVNTIYALHEALRLVLEEGLEARFARHRLHHAALIAGLEALGLTLRVPRSERLPPLTTVDVPPGIDDAQVRRELLASFGIEIGAGLGPMKGKVWRIGLMGEGASRKNVMLCLTALHAALRAQGARVGDEALSAAENVYGTAR